MAGKDPVLVCIADDTVNRVMTGPKLECRLDVAHVQGGDIQGMHLWDIKFRLRNAARSK